MIQSPMIKPLSFFYGSAFLKSHMFLLPVLYVFYLSNNLQMGDYFLFQGLIVLINVLLQIPVGYLSDHVERRFILIISYTLFLGRILLWMFFHGPIIVLTGEIFYAFSKALFDSIESPILYDLLEQKNKTHKMVKAYSKLNFFLNLGGSMSALIGAWFYETCGLYILLGTEFVFMITSIMIAYHLPHRFVESKIVVKTKNNLSEMWKNFILILKTSQYGPFIFYSAVLVSMSHFFFWSFQPMMKMASISSILVGIVIFTNNMMRSFGSLLSQKIAAYIPLTSLGCVVLVMDLCGLFLGYILQNVFDIQWVVIAFVFYLCICIVLQLIFTIIHTSRLQQIATPNIRSQISGVNMMMARLFVAMCLIVPKYLMMYVSFVNMYLIYGILLSIVGSYLLYNLKKQ